MTQLMQQTQRDVIKTDSGEIKLNPQIIKQYLVNGNGKITDQEVMLFLGLCKAQKLNPFNKDVYLIKFGDSPATMVTSKDVFLRRAIQNPKYRGMKSGVVIQNSEGIIEERIGTIYIKGVEILLGGWAEVKREGWDEPTKVTVAFDEYVGMTTDYKTKEKKMNSQWEKRGGFMITKVAESQALRKTFVDDMQGMYTEEEMDIDLSDVVATVPEQSEPQKLQDEVKQIAQGEGDVF